MVPASSSTSTPGTMSATPSSFSFSSSQLPLAYILHPNPDQVWHILSSAGLFFAFMFLLNVDEDIKFERRSQIPVF